jgi:hypothetical protein
MLEQCQQFRPLSLPLLVTETNTSRFPKNLNSHVLHPEGGIKRVVNPQ